MSTDLTFEAFRHANRQRCEQDFGRKVDSEAMMSMLIGLSEEAGEVAGAVRAYLGFNKRKTSTPEAIGDEIADLVQYADLLAQSAGLTLEAVLVAKFNRVSERIGSAVKLPAVSVAVERCSKHECVLVCDQTGDNGGVPWCWSCSQPGDNGPRAHRPYLATPGPASGALPPQSECPGCAKVARHPGEGYGCGLHPWASGALPQGGAGLKCDGTFFFEGMTWECVKPAGHDGGHAATDRSIKSAAPPLAPVVPAREPTSEDSRKAHLIADRVVREWPDPLGCYYPNYVRQAVLGAIRETLFDLAKESRSPTNYGGKFQQCDQCDGVRWPDRVHVCIQPIPASTPAPAAPAKPATVPRGPHGPGMCGWQPTGPRIHCPGCHRPYEAAP